MVLRVNIFACLSWTFRDVGTLQHLVGVNPRKFYCATQRKELLLEQILRKGEEQCNIFALTVESIENF